MKTTPCYECQKRYLGCHDYCESYQEFNMERKEFLEMRRKENEEKYEFREYKRKAIKRMSGKYAY